MLVIQMLSGAYNSAADNSRRNGFHWAIQDQAIIQAEALKAQRKAFGADRTRLDTRTPGLIHTGTPAAINRRRLNQWTLTNPTTRKLRVVPSSSLSSSSSGMDRDDDQDSVTYSPSMTGGSSSSFTGFSSSSGTPFTPGTN
jgi:hypothetical protein